MSRGGGSLGTWSWDAPTHAQVEIAWVTDGYYAMLHSPVMPGPTWAWVSVQTEDVEVYDYSMELAVVTPDVWMTLPIGPDPWTVYYVYIAWGNAHEPTSPGARWVLVNLA
jgi:hypothetical protein